MDYAAVVSTSSGFLALGVIPPIIWLLIYLREDRHAEPVHLILITFLGGAAAAIFALLAQEALFYKTDPFTNFFFTFFIVALVEEYAKYLAAKLLAFSRKDFNEPIDAMIYMMTAGMGFAAMENILFLFNQSYNPQMLIGRNLILGAKLSIARFIGANFLHALSSGVVGYAIARAWFSPHRKHVIALGILAAACLHAGFDYLIILKDHLPGSALYLAALLSSALIVILIDFHKLKGETAG
ncbi:MAG: PrsW family intramembrane metalloprotease [Candidatus Sungbacteria bacterium]|uniref:PrsW family intramembrane metalloprotease n=1 Tax=Candidatus Sungiibacteriota bacterium TaxID=2750080 RepID=A0A9D6QU24_9BACT|nr:PrsW family intramembrane metalloprotease [Candidatus Sungbacteria bacterium]